MYINQNARKMNETAFEYKLSHGLEGGNDGMGRIVEAKNVVGLGSDFIKSRRKFSRAFIPSDAVSVGYYLGYVYYNTEDAFYFDGEEYTEITLDKNTLTVGLGGFVCRYTANAEIFDLERLGSSRNGHYKAYAASCENRLEIKVEIIKN